MQSRLLTTLKKEAFENILGKGENAGKHHFLLFSKCFLPFPKQFVILVCNLLSANAFNLDYSNILSLCKALKLVVVAFRLGAQDYGSIDFIKQSLILATLEKKHLKTMWEKEKNVTSFFSFLVPYQRSRRGV